MRPDSNTLPFWIRRAAVAGCFFMTLSVAGAATAATDPEVETLRREIQTLRTDYEQRIAELEERLQALEASQGAPPSPTAAARDGGVEATVATSGEDELAALRAAALAAAGPARPAPEVTQTEATVGHERNLNQLNPEISMTGDIIGFAVGGQQDFDAREFELDIQSALDPFSTAKLTLSFAEEGVEVEEGYVAYNALASGLRLRAGKMRQTFGALNRFHLHALPQVDYPLVLQTYFAEEGLAQTGLSVEWLAPRPWASANEITFQLTDGSAEPFGGESFDQLAALLHIKNYFDLSPSTWLEWGLSGIVGKPTADRDTRVWGSDLTLHWQPPARAKYRELTWRSEVLFSQRDDPASVRQDAWGGYSYLEGLVRQNLYAGVRYDRVQDPLTPAEYQWAIEPYLSWWQSEFVRLRLAYQTLHDDRVEGDSHRFTLQITWAAGPHKHESY